jgi:hypothetical protein
MQENFRRLTRDQWNSEILNASDFQGSDKEFCHQNNLDLRQFGYHKRRHSKGLSRKSSFVKMDIPRVPGVKVSTLPDPKWLASFIHSYLDQG